MYEYLKKLFGKDEEGNDVALTASQLEEKIKADKELKIVNLAEGGYVSKEKFDAKETELTGVKGQLQEANDTIQSYKDMDIEGIKQSAADWEQKYNQDTEALKTKLAAQERTHAEEMFISGYDFTSKAARDGVMAAFRAKEFELKDGSFTGAKEFMDGLKDDEDYKAAFVAPPQPDPDPQPDPAGNPKPKFSDPKPGGDPKPKPKMTLSEMMAYKNEHPDAKISFE